MTAFEFIQALHGDPAEGYMTVCKKDGSAFISRGYHNRQKAVSKALEISQTEDTWYGVNPLKEMPGKYSRGKKSDVKALVACWVDIDIAGPGHKLENLCPDEEAAYELLKKMPHRPTVVVHTGGGLHAYWFLKQPFEINDKQQLERASKALKGWENLLKSKTDYKIDSTAELARVLRLPGTKNWKNEEPRDVKIISAAYSRRFNLEDFEKHLPEEKAPAKKLPPRKADNTPKRVEAWLQAVGTGQEGERNNTLFRLTKDLKIGWILPDHVVQNIAFDWAQRCNPPIETEEAQKTIDSAMSSPPEPGKPYGYLVNARGKFTRVTDEVDPPEESEIEPNQFPLTDTGNAELLHALYGNILKHVPAWRTDRGSSGFVRYKSGTYQRDNEDAFVTRLCIEAARFRGMRAAKKPERTWAIKSENASQIGSSKRVLKCLPGIQADPEDFDADKWSLNCANGILDLRTAEIRPHTPEELHTKQVPVEYDSGASCPLWMDFLHTIMEGDNEMILFLQRWIGYNLTGSVREHAVCVFYGDGGNGKGTLCETLMRLLAGYGHKTSFSTFLQCRAQRPSEPTPHLAELKGARLVLASESGEDQALNEPLLKELSGGDTIHARELFGKPFTFEPTHKITMLTNHRPRVRGGDYGIWRRLMLVPFEVKIPPEKMDLDLPTKLLAELPGILRWAVIGCLQWQTVGLKAPEKVLQATSDYQSEEDPVFNFLRERCAPAGYDADATDYRDKGYFVSSGDLFSAFKRWAEDNNELKFSRWSQKKFASRVKQRSLIDRRCFFYHRFPNERGFVGIRLTSDFNLRRNEEIWPDDTLRVDDTSMTHDVSSGLGLF